MNTSKEMVKSHGGQHPTSGEPNLCDKCKCMKPYCVCSKFENWYKICDLAKANSAGARFVVVKDLMVLGDTPQEISNNIHLFFENKGYKIETTDGITIQCERLARYGVHGLDHT